MGSRERLVRYWPLFGLEVRSPRLVLTPVRDEHLPDLMDAELAGIHDPAELPFDVPWSTAPPDELVPGSLRHLWGRRAATTAQRWDLQFAVLLDGVAIGLQDVRADDFAVVRSVTTGSWLRRDRQGSGLGTEMRAAILLFAFDHLGARRAESAAFADNARSLRVSEKLGYVGNGSRFQQRRPGESVESHLLLVTPDTLVRPDWTVRVRGLAECRPQLGI
ncbi:GNAT family N-acetyltransferase [Nakamurella deserti]|uniref:GNAT family N-acetyltransferase n=1 Tax=Nakamurella deserti TaxID=2164074 RepID=UPI000DBE9CC2|nr:GNAT family N-acetyltransferase [Nakamurella deserti]